MKKYIKLIRIKHHIKTVLVWIPLLCSGRFLEPKMLISTLFCFFAFFFMSSVIYIINDIMDVEKDRKHPTKCNRPIASGAVSIRNAWIAVVVLFILSMVCNLVVFNISGLIILLLYLGINLAYCFGLKNFPIWDVAVLSLGGIARLCYASFATGCACSPWMYLTILCMGIFLTMVKRRNELRKIQDTSTREVLKYYSISFVDKVTPICAALMIGFYALWCRDEMTLALHLGQYLIATVPLMILLFLKSVMLMETPSDKDPIDVYLHDTTFVTLYLLWLTALIVLPIL